MNRYIWYYMIYILGYYECRILQISLEFLNLLPLPTPCAGRHSAPCRGPSVLRAHCLGTQGADAEAGHLWTDVVGLFCWALCDLCVYLIWFLLVSSDLIWFYLISFDLYFFNSFVFIRNGPAEIRDDDFERDCTCFAFQCRNHRL